MQSSFLSSIFASFRTTPVAQPELETRAVAAPIELEVGQLDDVVGGGPAGTWAAAALKAGPASSW